MQRELARSKHAQNAHGCSKILFRSVGSLWRRSAENISQSSRGVAATFI